MSETLDSLSRRRNSAAQLSTVVRTMKALAASNIAQYERAVESLEDYYHTVSLSLFAILSQSPKALAALHDPRAKKAAAKQTTAVALVFGSDQGLVGRFNDTLAEFAIRELKQFDIDTDIWVVGEQMGLAWPQGRDTIDAHFPVPTAVGSITALLEAILAKIEEAGDEKPIEQFTIFYQAPQELQGYKPAQVKLLPLDKEWINYLAVDAWPGKKVPQIIGPVEDLLPHLTREYLFVSLYKAAAGSLASENASRLEAMQRAQKNIDEMQDELNQSYNRLRQSSIDSELFDLIAGFEALQK